jgi:hypothetical protein
MGEPPTEDTPRSPETRPERAPSPTGESAPGSNRSRSGLLP